MGVSKRTKTDKLKSMKVGNTDLGTLLGAVMKVKPPKVTKKARTKKKVKK